MKIAVFDDEKYSREELIYQIRQVLPDADIREAASGADAIEAVEQETFDLLFIDVRLGDIMGTTIAALVRKLMPHAQIVLATAYSEYAVKAFEVGVDNYILKPFDPKRVQQVLELCQAELRRSDDHGPEMTKIAVTVNRHTTLIDVADIVYIETSSSGRHCVIHTPDKEYTSTQSLSGFETKLAPHGFFRIHKTCLVQLSRIQDIFPWSNNGFALHMQGFSAVLPIGRDRIKPLREKFQL